MCWCFGEQSVMQERDSKPEIKHRYLLMRYTTWEKRAFSSMKFHFYRTQHTMPLTHRGFWELMARLLGPTQILFLPTLTICIAQLLHSLQARWYIGWNNTFLALYKIKHTFIPFFHLPGLKQFITILPRLCIMAMFMGALVHPHFPPQNLHHWPVLTAADSNSQPPLIAVSLTRLCGFCGCSSAVPVRPETVAHSCSWLVNMQPASSGSCNQLLVT